MNPAPPKPQRERLSYDAVFKDLFQRDHPTLLTLLTGGVAVKRSLNVELAIVQERKPDLLFELVDGSLFLVDIQGANDRVMDYRIGIYILVASEKYGKQVRAVVLYTGMKKLRMVGRLDAGSVKVNYEIIDIRQFDAETLLRGGPGDWALALLANGGPERRGEIIAKAMALPSPQRERLLVQLFVLSGLRHLDKEIKMEMEEMGAYIDIQENVILKDIWDKGKAEGAMAILSGLLEEKFGPVPDWAVVRLREATEQQTQLWSRKVLTASTLEAVVGRK